MLNIKHSLSDIILNVHAPAEDKIDEVKNSFYEELQHVFDELPKHNFVNFVRRFQCHNRQRRRFQTDNSE
jgi:hypothetical protein